MIYNLFFLLLLGPGDGAGDGAGDGGSLKAVPFRYDRAVNPTQNKGQVIYKRKKNKLLIRRLLYRSKRQAPSAKL